MPTVLATGISHIRGCIIGTLYEFQPVGSRLDSGPKTLYMCTTIEAGLSGAFS